METVLSWPGITTTIRVSGNIETMGPPSYRAALEAAVQLWRQEKGGSEALPGALNWECGSRSGQIQRSSIEAALNI